MTVSSGSRVNGKKFLKTKVETSSGRKKSSTKWLHRHINDKFVKIAKIDGYRARSAYKLIEIHEKFKIFHNNVNVVLDLGAAPGGWLQVAQKYLKTDAKIIGIDLLEIEPISNIFCIQQDIKDDISNIFTELKISNVDIILSDMAHNSSGNTELDHIRSIELCEMAFITVKQYLSIGGSFIFKILKGADEIEFIKKVKEKFSYIKYFKPESSRKESVEIYVICKNFCVKKYCK